MGDICLELSNRVNAITGELPEWDPTMKFCYLDESGTGEEPVGVMVGIITDHHRMKPTKSEWRALLDSISRNAGKAITELHTKELYAGNSPFRQLKADQRKEIIQSIFTWLSERKHSVIYTAVDRANFSQNVTNEPNYRELGSLWNHMAFHMALSLQKYGQTYAKNKGNFVLIFDRHVMDQEHFTQLIIDPPTWSESYYGKGKKQDPLDQIVDVPHFVDSKQVGLIQVADFLSYFLRKHLELSMGLNEKFEGEKALIEGYATQTFKMSIPKANMFLSKGRCSTADYFYKYAPAPLR